MDTTNVVYGVGRRTSANSAAVRHIDNGSGLPLCGDRRKSGKGRGHAYVQDVDVPTCKHCLKLLQDTTENAKLREALKDSTFYLYGHEWK